MSPSLLKMAPLPPPAPGFYYVENFMEKRGLKSKFILIQIFLIDTQFCHNIHFSYSFKMSFLKKFKFAYLRGKETRKERHPSSVSIPKYL